MGNACCVAGRAKALSNRTSSDDFRRNARHSPSWSFRRDNCRRVASEIDNLSNQPCDGINELDGTVGIEIKGGFVSERRNISDGETPFDNVLSPISQKSPGYVGQALSSLTPSDASFRSSHFPLVNNYMESPEISEAVSLKLPSSLSSPAFSTSQIDALASRCQIMPPSNATPSRRARRSPGHQLFRQISDSRILGLKSPNSNSLSEGRPSFVLSTSTVGHDLSIGSQGGGELSCDGWSLRTFSELVASSQRERWSFDSEHFGSGRHKISGSSSRLSYSPSSDMRTCGACSKLLSEKTSFMTDEIPVAAVLVCGHAYHADCLEMMAPEEANKYDPSCPLCMVGEKQVTKMSKKALRAEAELKLKFHKKLKNRVMDSYLGSDLDGCELGKRGLERGRNICKTEASSSTSSKLTFGRPFLKRHFSIGSKWMRTVSENDSAKKKGFWGRHRKD